MHEPINFDIRKYFEISLFEISTVDCISRYIRGALIYGYINARGPGHSDQYQNQN